jgi:hypothetical protein
MLRELVRDPLLAKLNRQRFYEPPPGFIETHQQRRIGVHVARPQARLVAGEWGG